MKVCVIQPPYSADYSKTAECYEIQMSLLNQCNDSMDIIVLPEAADTPSLAKTREQRDLSRNLYTEKLLKECADTAVRCNAVVFVNAMYKAETGYRNTTYAFRRDGSLAGLYFKEHPTQGEVDQPERDSQYSYEHTEPTVVEIDGLRYGFLTCYDFYFYENFSNMAQKNLDIIIGCSHQRSDSHQALQIMTQFLAYNTNTYVLRSSVSMDEDSEIGGASMIVSPDGTVLGNLKSKIGLITVDIDPKAKYYKPAGFGNPPAAHYEYIEKGRRPWKYRPAGSAICLPDNLMPYPRTCAHRGFNTIAPENSMPAFGAAVAMGAEEIEFDLWWTKDGEIVSIHDKTLERVSDGEGFVYEHTYEELLNYDFGFKHGERFKGMKIIKFEEILKKFACHVIMNIHIKTIDNDCEYDRETLEKIVALIEKYDCKKYVYFMCGNDNFHKLAQEVAPEIARCMGGGKAPWEIVDRAIKYGCKKAQLMSNRFDQAMVDKAHENGIICNVFQADTVELAKEYLDMGVDTILTNDYNLISQVVNEYK